MCVFSWNGVHSENLLQTRLCGSMPYIIMCRVFSIVFGVSTREPALYQLMCFEVEHNVWARVSLTGTIHHNPLGRCEQSNANIAAE